MKIAVTGATGFVGRVLLKRLREAGHETLAIVRAPQDASLGECHVAGSLEEADAATLAHALRGYDAVAHLAALTHGPAARSGDDEEPFRRVNVDGTLRLLHAVQEAGVGRVVYLSSIKVNGEETAPGTRFTGADIPAPADAYGRTKRAAERLLGDISGSAGFEAVILRPPLVYGPGVGGNLGQLIAAVRRGIPLPFASIRNARSLISVENLADALIAALTRPGIGGLVATVSDDGSVATPDIVRGIGVALGKRPLLVPVPPFALRAAGQMLGRGETVRRLLGNLEVDNRQAVAALGWEPRGRIDAAGLQLP